VSRYSGLFSRWYLTGQVLCCDATKITGWVRHMAFVVPPKLQVRLDGRLLGTAKLKSGSLLGTGIQRWGEVNRSPSLSKPKYWEFSFCSKHRPCAGSVIEVSAAWSGSHLAGSPWTVRHGVPPSPFVFMHIPKTAGTSLRGMLETAFENSGVFPSRDYLWRSGGRYVPPAQLGEVLKGVGENTSLVLGHYRYDLLRKILPQSSIFTMVRSPESQIVSLLKHQRAQTGDNYESLAMDSSGVVRPAFRNVQAKFFLSEDELRCMTEGAAQRAASGDEMRPKDFVTQRLREFALVGVSEKFQESCLQLETILGRSLGDPQRDNQTRLPDEKVSSDLINRLLEENQIDQLIYDLATATL